MSNDERPDGPGAAVSVGYDHQEATQIIWLVNGRLTSPRCCGGARQTVRGLYIDVQYQ